MDSSISYVKKKGYHNDCTPEEAASRVKFIDITDRINLRHPFLVLLEFVEDFFEGEFSKDLVSKYHILDYVELHYTLERILKLEGTRIKRYTNDARSKNLSNKKWAVIYDFVLKNSNYFRHEQLYLLNYNLLKASIILYMFNQSGRTSRDYLINNIQSIVSKETDRIEVLKSDKISSAFSKFIQNGVDNAIDDIIEGLKKLDFLHQSGNVLKLNTKYADVLSNIKQVLSKHPNGISYDSFYRKVEKENPVLEFIPRTGLIESALKQLEQSMQVTRIPGYWRYHPYKDTLILSSDLEKKTEEIKAELNLYSETAFFGRKIGPNNFVDELVELRRGDLDDTDDQVTRIAGIFLSLSPHLEIKHDNIPLFDFSLTIQPQYKTIQVIDSSKNTVSKYHILLKIGSPIDTQLAHRILQSLPESDKAILVTLKDVDVKIRTIFQDKVIVYGYEHITSLIRKIGKLPARVNSIAKIMYGNHRNTIVRINSLDYESRMSYVTILPNSEDLTVGLDCLNEIWLGNSNNDDNELYSTNYQQFLSIISNHADRTTIERGLINPKIGDIKCIVRYGEGLDYLERYLDPYDEKQIFFIETSNSTGDLNKIKLNWQVNVDGYTVKIFYDSKMNIDSKIYSNSNLMIKEVFHCTCMYWDGIIHSFPLCSHLVTALDLMVKKTDCLNKTWMKQDMNIVTNLLAQFIKLNDRSVIEALVMYIQESDFSNLVSYIDNLQCLDKRSSQTFISLKSKLRDEMLKNVNRRSEISQLFLKMEKAISRMLDSEVQQIIISLK